MGKKVEDNDDSGCCFEVSLAEARVFFSVPSEFEAQLRAIFPSLVRLDTNLADDLCTLQVRACHIDTYELFENSVSIAVDLTRDQAILGLAGYIVHNIAERTNRGVALHAGCVSLNGHAVLLAGRSGAGKSTLVAWLVNNGFEFRGDELVIFDGSAACLTSFPRALVLKNTSLPLLSGMAHLAACRSIEISGDVILNPPRGDGAFSALGQKVVLFPEFVPNSGLAIRNISPAMTCRRLIEHTVNADNFTDGGIGALAQLTRDALAIDVRYGSFDQLVELFDDLKTHVLVDSADIEESRRLLRTFEQSVRLRENPAPRSGSLYSPAILNGRVKVTIGMPTYDDYDGVYFSLQALRMYHGDALDSAELIVVDNNPRGKCAEALKKLGNDLPRYRYIAQDEAQGTAVAKQRIFTEASGDIVVCMDGHVLVMPGALAALLGYFDRNPATRDLLQGPLLLDNLCHMHTHLEPGWRGGMFGKWDYDDRAADPGAPPFEIEMQGLGLFACRKEAWQGFNPLFRGFGGEEGYLHEKFRRADARTLCLPFLRWVHRFNRPLGLPYRNVWEDRIWNYLIGFDEIGWDTSGIKTHFASLLGPSKSRSMFEFVERNLEQLAGRNEAEKQIRSVSSRQRS